jgi:hypothetical protein
METKALYISDITDDHALQMRVAGTQEDVVLEYVEAMTDGAVFPAVEVYYDGSVHWLADGFHRVEASRRLGRLTVDANVHTGSKRDAVLHAIRANVRHGLRATRADKRRALELMLRDAEWVKWSDRAIGQQCGVDGKTVAAVAAELGIVRKTRTTQRGGRVYEIATDNIGARKTTAETPQIGKPSKSTSKPTTTSAEPTDKDRAAAEKVARDYSWTFDDALVYVLCQRSKREQDAARRAAKREELQQLRQKVARKLRRDLSEQKRKRIEAGLLDAVNIAQQYGVATSVVLDAFRHSAEKKK